MTHECNHEPSCCMDNQFPEDHKGPNSPPRCPDLSGLSLEELEALVKEQQAEEDRAFISRVRNQVEKANTTFSPTSLFQALAISQEIRLKTLRDEKEELQQSLDSVRAKLLALEKQSEIDKKLLREALQRAEQTNAAISKEMKSDLAVVAARREERNRVLCLFEALADEIHAKAIKCEDNNAKIVWFSASEAIGRSAAQIRCALSS